MAYIVAQKIVKDNNGSIIHGSASIVESIYVKEKEKRYHSRHSVRERLGKVIWLSSDKKSGIFLSPTRGLTAYDSKADRFSEVSRDDKRISNSSIVFDRAPVHTVFGDCFLLLQFLKDNGMLFILKSILNRQEDFERLICHVMHGVLKDGSKISCGDFISKSVIASLLKQTDTASLDTDTHFFSLMGNESAKLSFFKAFISTMKKKYPDFGVCSLIDSVPFHNNVESRVIFLVDIKTNLPVWFENTDKQTDIKILISDISDKLGLTVEHFILDSEYISEEILGYKNGFTIRKSIDYRSYDKDVIDVFTLNGKKYFSKKIDEEILGHSLKAYLYFERDNSGQKAFILFSKKDTTAKDILNKYIRLTAFEIANKSANDFEETLPENKWNQKTINGKILYETIITIIKMLMKKIITKTGNGQSKTLSQIYGKTQSLMCLEHSGNIFIETPNRQIRESFKLLGVDLSSTIKVKDMRRDFLSI